MPVAVVPNRKAVGNVIVPVRLPSDIWMVKLPETVVAVVLAIEKFALKAPVTSGMPGLYLADPAIVMDVGVPFWGPSIASMVMVVLIGVAACKQAQNKRVGTRNPHVRNMGTIPPFSFGAAVAQTPCVH